MATTKNYYDLLGVSKDAPKGEIRKAYLELARKYHPDRTGGDKDAEDKLKEINNAYDTLKNEEKRKEYDQMLAGGFGRQHTYQGQPGGGFEGFSGAQGTGGFSFEGDFSDLFGDMFGGGRSSRTQGPQRAAAQPGRDIEVSLTVTLEEAASGAKKTIRVPRTAQCGQCQGSGAASGTQPQTCPQCNGTGQASRGGQAFFISQPCPRCHGRGQVITSPCPQCQGTGQVTEKRTVTVTIPRGVDAGTRLRLVGQGDVGSPGGRTGDLYVAVKIASHPLFERDSNNLICKVPITFAQAALGDRVRVPTLNGQANLKIPAGAQPGQTLRMRGQGIENRHGRKGDLLVKLEIEVPTNPPAAYRDLLTQLNEQDAQLTYPKRRDFERKLQQRGQ